MTYQDTVNYKSTCYTLLKLRDPEEVLTRVKKILPGWITKESNKFALECNKLNQEWFNNCKWFKLPPLNVLLVNGTYDNYRGRHNNRYKTLHTCYEVLMRAGYYVKSDKEFIECSDCKLLTISKMTADLCKLPYNGQCCACRRKKKKEDEEKKKEEEEKKKKELTEEEKKEDEKKEEEKKQTIEEEKKKVEEKLSKDKLKRKEKKKRRLEKRKNERDIKTETNNPVEL